MPIAEPADGFTQTERIILRELILSVYLSIEDPIDKFILMATHESQYNQSEVGKMLGISQVAVHKRLNSLRRTLKRARKNGEL